MLYILFRIARLWLKEPNACIPVIVVVVASLKRYVVHWITMGQKYDGENENYDDDVEDDDD